MDYNMVIFIGGSFLVFFGLKFKFKLDELKVLKKEKEYEQNYISTEFTRPEGFGYKLLHGWMAVKTNEYLEVAEYLSENNQKLTNWECGINYAYGGACFVTPSFKGWTLVISPGFFIDSIYQKSDLLEKLQKMSIRFGEIQLFTSFRIVSQNSWVKIINGEITRAFSTNNSVWFDIGEMTEIEKKLLLEKKIEFENERTREDEIFFENEMESFIDEEDVFKVAGDWSINPQDLNSSEYEEIDKRLGVSIWGKTIFEDHLPKFKV